MNPNRQSLLSDDDPPPVEIINPGGSSPFLLIGDHAGNAVPERLDRLGVAEAELHRHIGWDIGIAALGDQLATRIDASFVRQAYSRLVIDCNRDPEAADAVPEVSDGTRIPAIPRHNDSDEIGPRMPRIAKQTGLTADEL